MATGRMEQVGNGAIESTKEAVSMCITMLGIMSMWMGFMNVASKSGMIKKLEKILEPLGMGGNTGRTKSNGGIGRKSIRTEWIRIK